MTQYKKTQELTFTQIVEERGAVTVFVTLCIFPLFLLMSFFIDSTRALLARPLFDQVQQQTLDNILSSNDEDLANQFDLYALTQAFGDGAFIQSDSTLTTYKNQMRDLTKTQYPNFGDFLKIESNEADNSIKKVELANLGNPAILEKQIVEAAKYVGAVRIMTSIYGEIKNNRTQYLNQYEKYKDLAEAMDYIKTISNNIQMFTGFYAQSLKLAQSLDGYMNDADNTSFSYVKPNVQFATTTSATSTTKDTLTLGGNSFRQNTNNGKYYFKTTYAPTHLDAAIKEIILTGNNADSIILWLKGRFLEYAFSQCGATTSASNNGIEAVCLTSGGINPKTQYTFSKALADATDKFGKVKDEGLGYTREDVATLAKFRGTGGNGNAHDENDINFVFNSVFGSARQAALNAFVTPTNPGITLLGTLKTKLDELKGFTDKAITYYNTIYSNYKEFYDWTVDNGYYSGAKTDTGYATDPIASDNPFRMMLSEQFQEVNRIRRSVPTNRSVLADLSSISDNVDSWKTLYDNISRISVITPMVSLGFGATGKYTMNAFSPGGNHSKSEYGVWWQQQVAPSGTLATGTFQCLAYDMVKSQQRRWYVITSYNEYTSYIKSNNRYARLASNTINCQGSNPTTAAQYMLGTDTGYVWQHYDGDDGIIPTQEVGLSASACRAWAAQGDTCSGLIRINSNFKAGGNGRFYIGENGQSEYMNESAARTFAAARGASECVCRNGVHRSDYVGGASDWLGKIMKNYLRDNLLSPGAAPEPRAFLISSDSSKTEETAYNESAQKVRNFITSPKIADIFNGTVDSGNLNLDDLNLGDLIAADKSTPQYMINLINNFNTIFTGEHYLNRDFDSELKLDWFNDPVYPSITNPETGEEKTAVDDASTNLTSLAEISSNVGNYSNIKASNLPTVAKLFNEYFSLMFQDGWSEDNLNDMLVASYINNNFGSSMYSPDDEGAPKKLNGKAQYAGVNRTITRTEYVPTYTTTKTPYTYTEVTTNDSPSDFFYGLSYSQKNLFFEDYSVFSHLDICDNLMDREYSSALLEYVSSRYNKSITDITCTNRYWGTLKYTYITLPNSANPLSDTALRKTKPYIVPDSWVFDYACKSISRNSSSYLEINVFRHCETLQGLQNGSLISISNNIVTYAEQEVTTQTGTQLIENHVGTQKVSFDLDYILFGRVGSRKDDPKRKSYISPELAKYVFDSRVAMNYIASYFVPQIETAARAYNSRPIIGPTLYQLCHLAYAIAESSKDMEAMMLYNNRVPLIKDAKRADGTSNWYTLGNRNTRTYEPLGSAPMLATDYNQLITVHQLGKNRANMIERTADVIQANTYYSLKGLVHPSLDQGVINGWWARRYRLTNAQTAVYARGKYTMKPLFLSMSAVTGNANSGIYNFKVSNVLSY
ncbi:MAG: hypothetical protein LBN03_00985 [Bifidobacteriaceae bacterium]|jgi:hypothetical protein|nr:hypothetical protein [Bifidobacteriaceae bacterium]